MSSFFSRIVELIHAPFGWLVAILALPFGGFDPIWALLSVSVVVGAILVVIYGRVSNQEKLRLIKREITANILESALFRDDFWIAIKAQGRLIGCAVRYLSSVLPAFFVLAIPCILVMSQLNSRYGYRGLNLGESVLVRVSAPSQYQFDNAALVAANGAQVSLPLRIPNEHEINWRVTLTNLANRTINLKIGDYMLATALATQGERPELTPHYLAGVIGAVLYPSIKDVGLKSSQLDSLVIAYPSAEYTILGVKMSWILIFMLASLVSGLCTSFLFKIEL